MGSFMKSFTITYRDFEGDVCHVSIEAATKEDAKIQLKREYWDVNEIISVRNE